ncbi:MAG: hypothetical protein GIW95_11345 [Candidatus Eremiobacteraeota bacterium]|nr:hypothetical protein [Candidatus Eremiobacteraeota bacterium]
MKDDLAYVGEQVPGYEGYGDELTRHASDVRIRTTVGAKLAEARAAHASELDADALKALDAVILQCVFADQDFVKTIEHADLHAEANASLVGLDRKLVELAERVERGDAVELSACVAEIEANFAARLAALAPYRGLESRPAR